MLTLVMPCTYRRMEFRDLARRIQPPAGLWAHEWQQHELGGGWVQKTARVAPTAFVGPNVVVSGEAQILDFAEIMDEASITGAAIVAGHALVGGSAYVGGQAKVIGVARIIGTAEVGGFFLMTEGEITGGSHRPLSRLDQKRWKNCLVP